MSFGLQAGLKGVGSEVISTIRMDFLASSSTSAAQDKPANTMQYWSCAQVDLATEGWSYNSPISPPCYRLVLSKGHGGQLDKLHEFVLFYKWKCLFHKINQTAKK